MTREASQEINWEYWQEDQSLYQYDEIWPEVIKDGIGSSPFLSSATQKFRKMNSFERVPKRVLIGRNEDKNHVPSCAGYASGHDQIHVHPDLSTGCYSK